MSLNPEAVGSEVWSLEPRLERRFQDALSLLSTLPLLSSDNHWLFAYDFTEKTIGWNSTSGWTAASLRQFLPISSADFSQPRSVYLELNGTTTHADLNRFRDDLDNSGYLHGLKHLPSRVLFTKTETGPVQEWLFRHKEDRVSAVRLHHHLLPSVCSYPFVPDLISVIDYPLLTGNKVHGVKQDQIYPCLKITSSSTQVL